MKLSQQQRIHTVRVGKLIAWATARGYGLTFGEAWRTDEQQAIYLANGKSKKKRSLHQDRLANDFNLFTPEHGYVGDDEPPELQYELHKPLGEHWESLGGTWGGRFYGHWDSNHYESREVDPSELVSVPGDPVVIGAPMTGSVG